MSESTGPVLNLADEEELGETFAHPAEGEQEKSAEDEETLSDDEKSSEG